MFPAHLPKGREQVIMLSQTLGLMLKQSHKTMCNLLTNISDNNNKERMDEFICNFNFDDILMNEYNIWDIVLSEVGRQCYSECNERGELIEKIRTRLLELFQFSNQLFNTLKSLHINLGERYVYCLTELNRPFEEREKERKMKEEAEKEKRMSIYIYKYICFFIYCY